MTRTGQFYHGDHLPQRRVEWHATEGERVHHKASGGRRERPIASKEVSDERRVELAVVGDEKLGNSCWLIWREHPQSNELRHRLLTRGGAIEDV